MRCHRCHIHWCRCYHSISVCLSTAVIKPDTQVGVVGYHTRAPPSRAVNNIDIREWLWFMRYHRCHIHWCQCCHSISVCLSTAVIKPDTQQVVGVVGYHTRAPPSRAVNNIDIWEWLWFMRYHRCHIHWCQCCHSNSACLSTAVIKPDTQQVGLVG